MTFADAPMITALPPAGHLHHQGMEEMRAFLLPGQAWLAGTMLMDLLAAGMAIFGKRRH
ncbi:hypothetical protein [Massilia soli]|uniref:hypothetical protein n=1 Tax=Massilia soli TaxID=2792854 RepID=UPI001CC014E9|nr:hypothetical protein [Massilia soli]